MTREELKYLFNTYLKRDFQEREWSYHGKKSYNDFEKEIQNCQEYRNLGFRAEPGKKNTTNKIALLLTGHIRKNSILNGILTYCGHYDFDVFVHTWSNIGIKGSETNLNDRINTQAVEDMISRIPNVKKYVIENNKDYISTIEKKANYFNYSSAEPFIKSQLYSINKCFGYAEEYANENKIKYDVVFKFRFDSDIFGFNLSNNTIKDIISNDLIFVPNSDNQHHHPDHGTSCWVCDNMYYHHKLKTVHVFDHSNIICDLFAYGNFNAMKKYCSLYDEYDNLNNKFYNINVEQSKKINRNLVKEGDDYRFKGQTGHLDTLYYYYCSYPERMLQQHLKDFMLIESREVRLKLVR